MRFSSFSLCRAFVMCAGLMFSAPGLPAHTLSSVNSSAQEQSKGKAKEQGTKISADEFKAEKKVKEAKDVPAKFAAASEFVKKYPQSALRPQVAYEVVKAISELPDTSQRISFFENFLTTFTNETDTAPVYPVLIGAYINTNRVEQAFNTAPKVLAKTPNEAYVLYLLTLAGINEAQRGNSKYLQQSLQYSQKAIELFEANQRPASVSEQEWSSNKNQWQSQLYQSAALLALSNKKNADAQSHLQKAAALTPTDPMIFYVLSGAKNDEYQQLITQYKATPAGAAQETARQTAEAKLDEVIELYARVLALTEGKEQFKQMHAQTLSDMTTYYKFRHNNSTDGMQEFINKFKTPATP